MTKNISKKEKNTYIGLLGVVFILMAIAIYQIKVYDKWVIFWLSLAFAVLGLVYQKRIGIKFSNKTNAYLKSIDKKYKILFYLSYALMSFSIIFSISTNSNFIILFILTSCYQLYMVYKMVDYAY